MKREQFNRLVEEALATLPEKFRARIHNVAILVEDYPPEPAPKRWPEPQRAPGKSPRPPHEAGGEFEDEDAEGLLMGEFIGTPATERSVWDNAAGPDRVVLYQKNIEAACKTDDEVREEVRLTVLHELGHYFGMTEDQLEDV